MFDRWCSIYSSSESWWSILRIVGISILGVLVMCTIIIGCYYMNRGSGNRTSPTQTNIPSTTAVGMTSSSYPKQQPYPQQPPPSYASATQTNPTNLGGGMQLPPIQGTARTDPFSQNTQGATSAWVNPPVTNTNTTSYIPSSEQLYGNTATNNPQLIH